MSEDLIKAFRPLILATAITLGIFACIWPKPEYENIIPAGKIKHGLMLGCPVSYIESNPSNTFIVKWESK